MKGKLFLLFISICFLGCAKSDNLDPKTDKNLLTNTNKVNPAAVKAIDPVFCFYSSLIDRHYFSTKENLPNQPYFQSFTRQNIVGYTGGSGPKLTMWRNKATGIYVLSTLENAVDINANEKIEEMGPTASPTDNGSFPVYEYYRQKTNSNSFYYTRNKDELGDGKYGFVYKRIAFYLIDRIKPDPNPNQWPQPLKEAFNGQFIHMLDSKKVFFMLEGEARYIQSQDTYNGIFNQNGLISRIYLPDESYLQVKRGKDLTPDCDFRRDITTNRLYLREGNVLMHINGSTVMKVYNFNKNAVQHQINGTAGYVLGLEINNFGNPYSPN
ncbi:hypothetical protein TH53_23930 [Pedobacter lusitanus]|uniref:Uncharacterized protein n=1 Tax=Pedobacter lusitanus TaxID=1503925 RepID=A0A0D0GC69_9SPHI|nr:hypothetical protein [Pedobacter lusitanus]KIO74877.1 hypothetical protein TH53_23930 [Pedobacter lusitanus]